MKHTTTGWDGKQACFARLSDPRTGCTESPSHCWHETGVYDEIGRCKPDEAHAATDEQCCFCGAIRSLVHGGYMP